MNQLYTKEFYENLPKKRMAAGVLFFDENQKFLIVRPNYKHCWDIPGGIIEVNESPMRACIREIKEELGINKNKLSILCIDYTGKRGDKNESLQFIFYGGTLNDKEIKEIKLQPEELIEFKFVSVEESKEYLNPDGSRFIDKRIKKSIDALKQQKVIYLENSEVA